jgi:ATP-dependent DNA helicase RecG
MKTRKKSRLKTVRRKGDDDAARLRREPPAEGLLRPVESVKGIGPRTASALERRGIRTIEDLLYFLPSRYEDRRLVVPISDVVEGQESVVAGKVVDSGRAYSRATRKKLCYARIDDGSGVLTLRWFRFHKGWIETVCRKENTLLASGKVVRFGSELQIVHPKVTVVEEGQDADSAGGIVPVYPEVEGVSQGALARIVREAIDANREDIASLIPDRMASFSGLPSLREALTECHFPHGGLPDDPMEGEYAARVILEEFFLFQFALLSKRKKERSEKGIVLKPGECYQHLVAKLPFGLTAGQDRARREIEQDLSGADAMNRLLQGDVGCGKTILAVLAAAIAVDSGKQAVFMAPTEILAEQHYLSIHRMFEEIGIEPVLVRGNMGAERNTVLDRIGSGDARVVVGTHALLEPDVVFGGLGLAVIDEQHRFGVIQRSLLKEKGKNPNVLVMSATPIPRTLSMVVYGDLDVSSIDDMPPGRQPVRTEVVDEKGRRKVHDAVACEANEGHQVFVVHPVIEESENADIMGAKEGLLEWRRLFPSLRVGLLHGRMRAEEKEAVMVAFRDGAMDVLVCTTVIEVGIDIPNATLMVVEHAERFGLSQLHQLRGRVGRGPTRAGCILVSSSGRTAAATRRLRALEKTNDGFAIAEEDMRLRGPGDMIGVRQAGIPVFRIGSIVKDGELMGRARQMARETLIAADPEEMARIEAAAERRWGERLGLGEVL